MASLKGKVVVLTGGSRGVGPIVAEAIAKRGARIALAARSKSGLQSVAKRLSELGAATLIVPVDLTESSQREELVITVLKEFGTIDVLVNNAGLETEGSYAELPWPSIRETIEVNFIAPMALTHLVLPEMLRKKAGHIVNVASIAAKSGGALCCNIFGNKGRPRRMDPRSPFGVGRIRRSVFNDLSRLRERSWNVCEIWDQIAFDGWVLRSFRGRQSGHPCY